MDYVIKRIELFRDGQMHEEWHVYKGPSFLKMFRTEREAKQFVQKKPEREAKT